MGVARTEDAAWAESRMRNERRWVDAGPKGLAGKRIEFPGLELTITDALVRIERLDGTRSTELIRPSRPWIETAAPRGTLATAGVFLSQGIEHILLGVDHLLFVLGLLLIVRTPWMLAKTITAFTLAHSITLALATLGEGGLLYSLGFVVATGCLHAIGIAIGAVHRWPAGQVALRVAGGGVGMAGLLFLWRAIS